jgi:hypothetical protein
VAANITEIRRAQQRIAERVGRHVRIRVTNEATAVGDQYQTQPEFTGYFVAGPMDVNAMTDSH